MEMEIGKKLWHILNEDWKDIRDFVLGNMIGKIGLKEKDYGKGDRE
jgi:hypothetical protein